VLSVGLVLNLRDGGYKEEDDTRGGEQTDSYLEEKAFPAGFVIRLREGHRSLPVRRSLAARIIASTRLECNQVARAAPLWQDGVGRRP
jgi:hypothetical protein